MHLVCGVFGGLLRQGQTFEFQSASQPHQEQQATHQLVERDALAVPVGHRAPVAAHRHLRHVQIGALVALAQGAPHPRVAGAQHGSAPGWGAGAGVGGWRDWVRRAWVKNPHLQPPSGKQARLDRPLHNPLVPPTSHHYINPPPVVVKRVVRHLQQLVRLTEAVPRPVVAGGHLDGLAVRVWAGGWVGWMDRVNWMDGWGWVDGWAGCIGCEVGWVWAGGYVQNEVNGTRSPGTLSTSVFTHRWPRARSSSPRIRAPSASTPTGSRATAAARGGSTRPPFRAGPGGGELMFVHWGGVGDGEVGSPPPALKEPAIRRNRPTKAHLEGVVVADDAAALGAVPVGGRHPGVCVCNRVCNERGGKQIEWVRQGLGRPQPQATIQPGVSKPIESHQCEQSQPPTCARGGSAPQTAP